MSGPFYDSPEIGQSIAAAIKRLQGLKTRRAEDVEHLPRVNLEIDKTWEENGVLFATGTVTYPDGRKEEHNGPLIPVVRDGKPVGYTLGRSTGAPSALGSEDPEDAGGDAGDTTHGDEEDGQ